MGTLAGAALVEACDFLYGLAPGEFVAERDRRAAEAKRDGDPALGKAIKALRRPTVSAWLANLLVRRQPDEVAQLLALGESMREAQSRLAGSALRELARRRQLVVTALARTGRELAAEAGAPAGPGIERELSQTLEAALADPAAGEALRAGHLTTGLDYAGFLPVDPTAETIDWSPTTPPPPSEPTGAGSDGRPKQRTGTRKATPEADRGPAAATDKEARAKAEALLDAARRAEEAARGRVAQDSATLQRLQSEHDELIDAIRVAAERLDQLGRHRDELDAELAEASSSVDAAQAALQAATEVVTAAQANLGDHRR